MRRKGLGAGSHACIGLMRSSMPTQLTRSRDLRVRRIFDASMQRHASPAACTCVRTRAVSGRLSACELMSGRACGVLRQVFWQLRQGRGVLRFEAFCGRARWCGTAGRGDAHRAARPRGTHRGERGRELKRKAPDQVLRDAAGHLLAEADGSGRQTAFPCVPVGVGVGVWKCVGVRVRVCVCVCVYV